MVASKFEDWREGLETSSEVGLPADELATPALILDLDSFERNATKVARFLMAQGVYWRPHTKGHKSPHLARLQIQVGAIGVTCAKTSEAEVMVESGIPSVLIANEQGLASAFTRIARLNAKAEVITCADSSIHVAMAAAAGIATGIEIPLLVSVDVGMHRSGVMPGDKALRLADLINATPGVRFLGLMGFEGHLVALDPPEEKARRIREDLQQLVDTAVLIREAGIDVPIVSGGGSGTLMTSGRVDGITENQAGGVCLMDLFYGERCHLADQFEYALTVLSTVTSRPAPDRVLVDAGFKAMSDNDLGRPQPVGHEGATLVSLAAEHGTLTLSPDSKGLEIGDRVRWIPGYSDSTVFLHNEIIGTRSDRVAVVIPLVCRGQLT